MSESRSTPDDEPNMDQLAQALAAYLELLEAGGDAAAFLVGHPLSAELTRLIQFRAELPGPSDSQPSQTAYRRGLARLQSELASRRRPRHRWRVPRYRFWVAFGALGLGFALSVALAAGPGPSHPITSRLHFPDMSGLTGLTDPPAEPDTGLPPVKPTVPVKPPTRVATSQPPSIGSSPQEAQAPQPTATSAGSKLTVVPTATSRPEATPTQERESLLLTPTDTPRPEPTSIRERPATATRTPVVTVPTPTATEPPLPATATPTSVKIDPIATPTVPAKDTPVRDHGGDGVGGNCAPKGDDDEDATPTPTPPKGGLSSKNCHDLPTDPPDDTATATASPTPTLTPTPTATPTSKATATTP